jgi:RNA polymerase sigma factor (sigma-70 family)
MAEMPDAALSELLAGCLLGDRRSQERLYRQFYGFAMAIGLRYTNNRDEALEVVNDGFLKVMTNLERYDANQPFKAWFRRILINSALDLYRRVAKHQHHHDLDAATGIAHDSPDAYSQLAYEDLIELIQQLTPAYRLVFNLFVLDGFSHEEISAQAGISVGTSKSNLARARENLRTLLQKKTNPDHHVRIAR